MLRYIDFEYYKNELDRCERGQSRNWGNVFDTKDLLNYQTVVYGNHTTKQVMESYTEYANDLQFAM